MNNITQQLLRSIDAKGWMCISTMYFDNADVCNMVNTNGYVCISEQESLVFWMSANNIWDSHAIDSTLVHSDPRFMGHGQAIITQNTDCLQHFDYALFNKAHFYWDEQETFPIPKFPTPAEILALEKDETTGLYPGTDTLYGMKSNRNPNGDPVSTIMMFKDDDFKGAPTKHDGLLKLNLNKSVFDSADYPNDSASTVFGVGVNIDGWKAFYKNQQKFVTAMKTFTGISDLR